MVYDSVLIFAVVGSFGMALYAFYRNRVLEEFLIEMAGKMKCDPAQLEQLHSNAVKTKACRETLTMIHSLTEPGNSPAKVIYDIRILCERALALIK